LRPVLWIKERMKKEAGPAADQPSRLRTPPGVGPRCRRLGAQVSGTRQLIGCNLLAKERRGALQSFVDRSALVVASHH